MHWENYDRLVKHLERADPWTFDYGNDRPDRGDTYERNDAGCLACHCAMLEQGADAPVDAKIADIQRFLDIRQDEAMYLFGYWRADFDAQDRTTGGLQDELSQCIDLIGSMGIAEALRRLSVVAGRYARPAGERRFMASVRALGAAVAADVD